MLPASFSTYGCTPNLLLRLLHLQLSVARTPLLLLLIIRLPAAVQPINTNGFLGMEIAAALKIHPIFIVHQEHIQLRLQQQLVTHAAAQLPERLMLAT